MPLLAWFEVWYSMMQRGGISMKVAEDIGAVQETAWFMAHRIREAMRACKEGMMLGGPGRIVEIDEAFPGGLEKFKRLDKRLFSGGGGKKGLISMVERGDSGRRITIKLPDKWMKAIQGSKRQTMKPGRQL